MAFQVANNLRFRRSFGRIRKIIDLPYLIEIQKNSYDLFLQKDAAPLERQSIGLQEVFKSVFPIKDFNETASLEFVSYSLGDPKYDVEECHQRGMTFAAPLKVTVQLVLWEVDQQTGSRSIKNVKEQEGYFGEIPLMTSNGTFMVNGTERVIVSQLHRSPGVIFERRKPALVFNASHLLGAKVSSDVRDPKSNELIVKEGKKFTRPVLRQMEAAKVKQVPIGWEEIVGRVA